MVTTLLEGGTANCLFQIANVLAHSIKYNLDYCVPLKVNNPHVSAQKMPHLYPGVKYYDMEMQLPLYKEKSFVYEPISFVDNVCFSGFFQSFSYFDFCRNEILKAFGFKWGRKKDWCAIHVRRTDYLQLPDHHPFVGEEYFKYAIGEMISKAGIDRFEVYSDDIAWCKDFFSTIPTCLFKFIQGNNEIQDLEQGSFCQNQILSNSTFSLWMYYLNQNPEKICIAPQRWFGPALNHDTKDLYPKNAIII